MVLVSYILNNYVSILQTKLSDREGHEARRGGLEALPLHQHIEGGHGEREPRLKIRPHAVHDFLEVADQRQHREDRLHEHTVLPLATLTQFEVGGIPLGGMETGITQDNQSVLRTAESATERCYRRHWRWHTPTRQSIPTDLTRDRVCRRQSSDGSTRLCGRSAAGSAPLGWDGSARSHTC